MDPLYEFLYDWANRILNTERSLNIPILQSHQDIQPPSEDQPYIVIDYAPSRTKLGSASYNDPDDQGKRNIVNDYSNVVEIWEVNGTGELLRILIDSIERQDIRDLWATNDYSYWTEGQIQNLPRTQENRWKRESMVEITIGSAVATEETIEGKSFEDVEFTGDVPAQGRSGDHTITNT